MKSSTRTHLLEMAAAALVLALASAGCAGPRPDPAGEARTTQAVTDAQVAKLGKTIELEELKRLWGPAEAQPGPRVTYKAADHPGKFFWVYYEQRKGAPKSAPWVVDSIILADSLEEGRTGVWTRDEPTAMTHDL